ncbi:hypothetical protein ACFY3U_27725 [Micromonospora sp. NPDC000089]|uniref:hypothetical protein n=1 Tax=unclassified Micromonospora TaxID=2617518 RepID=UPI0036B1A3F7
MANAKLAGMEPRILTQPAGRPLMPRAAVGMSRRRLLTAGLGVAAGLGAGTLAGVVDVTAAYANASTWTIDAAGWAIELVVFKRLATPDPGRLSGGFIANTRRVGVPEWEPALAYADTEYGRPKGVNFCRIVLRPDRTMEKLQIYRTLQVGPQGPSGYWFEVFAPTYAAPYWRRTDGTYPWKVVSGFSPTGAPWDLPVDTKPRATGGIELVSGQHTGIATWPITHPGGSGLRDMHWVDIGELRQSWMSLGDSGAIGWTSVNTVGGQLHAQVGWWKNYAYYKPLTFVRPLDTRFGQFEYYYGSQYEDAWYDDGEWASTVYWRAGNGLRFKTVSISPTGDYFGWRTNAFTINEYGFRFDLGDSALYDRTNVPYG